MKLVRCIFLLSVQNISLKKKCTKYCKKNGMKLVRCIFLVLNKCTKYFLKKKLYKILSEKIQKKDKKKKMYKIEGITT